MKAPALFCGALALVALLFLLAPGLDLATSRLFYDPAGGFVLNQSPPLRLFEQGVRWIAAAIAAIVAIGAVSLLFGRPLWRLDGRALVFLALATALGPGLFANTVLKDHWGRARPAQIERFGGTKSFSPAPLIADQCDRNCSFVSGHAALGFSLVGFAFLLPAGKRRRVATLAALGFGTAVGLGRIAAGRHFLSDVVYAGFLVTGTDWVLYQLIVVRDGLGRVWRSPIGRMALAAAAFVAVEAAAMVWLDRPLALYLHRTDAPVRPFFDAFARIGLGFPYLVFFAAMFAVLRWGGALPWLRRRAAAMRAAATAPGFLFLAVAASGLTADILKIVCGRARPKLLFAAGFDHFTWFAVHPDYWSFPSGHATTAAALMMGLWWLWPRYAPVYALVALSVAASRVVIGAHYLSDTMMGLALGAAATCAVALLFARAGLDPGRVRAV